MPTYQYACTQCSEQLEAVQSFSDAALTECPVCGGRLRKVFSAVGVVFKGSGFYKTDSRASANGSGSAADGAKKSETAAGGSDGKKDGAKKDAPAASGGSSSSNGSSGGSSSGGSSSGSSSSGGSSSGSGSSKAASTAG